VISTITQWDRRHWGAGGADFHWWCTEAPEAFVGSEPAYRSLRAELQALVGAGIYGRLEAYLDRRSGRFAPLPHPAVRARRG
jgi:hypothetical protein